MNPSKRTATAALALSAIAAGCTVGPDYTRPEIDAPEAYLEAPDLPDGALDPMALATWWRQLNDPVLDDLIERAIAGNLDLAIADERIREARAQRGVVAAGDAPQVDAGASYSRSKRSGAIGDQVVPDPDGGRDFYTLGFDATWELDLAGRVRRAVESADASIQATIEARRDVLVTLLSEVARNYAELRGYQLRLALAQRNRDLQADTVGLTRSRFEGGLSSELDLAQARAQLALTESAIPLLVEGERAAMYRLGVLLGTNPEALVRELQPAAPIPVGPPAVDPGRPADLLVRRPDLRAAEREAAAASAQIGVAEADLYPRVFLLGSIGWSAEDASNLFSSNAWEWGIGPSVVWRVFDGGRIRSNIEVQDARFEQVLLDYRRRVLHAFEEVERALLRHHTAVERVHALEQSIEANRRALTLSRDRYERGIGDFLSVLTAERNLLLVEDDLAQTQQEITTALIAVYKALGGGGEVPATGEPGDPAQPTMSGEDGSSTAAAAGPAEAPHGAENPA